MSVNPAGMYRHMCYTCNRMWLSDCHRERFLIITRWCPECIRKAGCHI